MMLRYESNVRVISMISHVHAVSDVFMIMFPGSTSTNSHCLTKAIRALNSWPFEDGSRLTVKKKGPPRDKGEGKGDRRDRGDRDRGDRDRS